MLLNIVTALLPRATDVDAAVERLRAKGVSRARITTMAADPLGRPRFGVQRTNKAAKGAVLGTIVGVGAGLAILALTQAVSALWPEIGSFWTEGITITAVIGLIAVVGLSAGALLGGQIPQYEVRLQVSEADRGGALVGVVAPAPPEAASARRTFQELGALAVDET